VFDDSLLDDLPATVDPCGEKGEFHTCVYDGPMFHDLMDLEPGRLEHREPFTWADLTLRATVDGVASAFRRKSS
jgi:diphthamide synthase (EF-2-diphthine--ammonia ligase)